MSEHDPDKNHSLDEIESNAAVVAGFWLHEARQAVEDSDPDEAKHYPAGILGFTVASAINYHAERQVDAAMKIADGLQAIAAAIRESKGVAS